jgi:rhodanese-related sulfurtransferase
MRAGTFFKTSNRCLVLLVAVLACAAGGDGAEITPDALLARSEAPLVLDVRSAEEFASGHVPGAHHLPFDQVATRLAELGPPREVVVYCERGPRAAKAAAVLAGAGFQVLHLAGHMSGWRAAGLPVER